MKGATDQQLGLAVELLTVILGLEEETLDRVIRVITDSQDIYDIKTDIILQRIGLRATRYLRNSIEIARHEGGELHIRGTEEEPDTWKAPDLDQTSSNRRPQIADVDTEPEDQLKRESLMFTFLDYIREMEENQNDPEDLTPQELNKRAQELKKMATLKSAGREKQVDQMQLRKLQKELRNTTDPRAKVDIQRRIREITAPEPQ